MCAERVAIVGSRPPKGGWDYRETCAIERKVWGFVVGLADGTAIVSGGAEGIDSIAEAYARHRGLPIIVHLPDWTALGKAAGAIRNRLIVNDCDRVVAFWDGMSRGTKITIDLAQKAGKPVEIVTIP